MSLGLLLAHAAAAAAGGAPQLATQPQGAEVHSLESPHSLKVNGLLEAVAVISSPVARFSFVHSELATPAFPAIETQPTAEVELAEVELGELRFDAAGRPVVGARGPRGPPAATSYAVMVPQGAMPGATLMTTTPGGLQVHVVVPQGAVPGSTFMVSA